MTIDPFAPITLAPDQNSLMVQGVKYIVKEDDSRRCISCVGSVNTFSCRLWREENDGARCQPHQRTDARNIIWVRAN